MRNWTIHWDSYIVDSNIIKIPIQLKMAFADKTSIDFSNLNEKINFYEKSSICRKCEVCF